MLRRLLELFAAFRSDEQLAIVSAVLVVAASLLVLFALAGFD